MTRLLALTLAASLVGALSPLPALSTAVAPSDALLGFAAPAAPAAATPAPGDAAPDDAAAPGARWAVGPADAAGRDARISLRHVVDPGAAASDHIAVSNLGGEDATYAVSVGDGRVGVDGAFDIAPGTPVDSGAWIRVGGLTDGRVAVPAGGTVVLPVTITVPADAVPGDHPAGIVVALSQRQDGITVTSRTGVRVHLQVAGEIAAALAVTGVDAVFTPSWIPFAPGRLRIAYQLENTGNVRLGAQSDLTATGPWGAAAVASTPTVVDELLPGDAASVVVETDVWPLGVAFGAVDVAPLVVGADAVTSPAPIHATVQTLAVSWTGLVALLVVAALIVGLLRRRGRTGRRVPEPAEPAASETTRPVALVGAGASTEQDGDRS